MSRLRLSVTRAACTACGWRNQLVPEGTKPVCPEHGSGHTVWAVTLSTPDGLLTYEDMQQLLPLLYREPQGSVERKGPLGIPEDTYRVLPEGGR